MDRLPTEIILNIFENLGYWDLIRLRLVNREFYDFLSNERESKLVFKDKLQVVSLSNSGKPMYQIYHSNHLFQCIKYVLPAHSLDVKEAKETLIFVAHPILFEKRKKEESEDDNWDGLTNTMRGLSLHTTDPLIRFTSLRDSSFANENATAPATDKVMLHIQPMSWDPILVQAPHGSAVTILNIFDAIIETVVANRVAAHKAWEEGRNPQGLVTTRLYNELQRLLLGYKVRWFGVEKVEVDGDGGVVNMWVKLGG